MRAWRAAAGWLLALAGVVLIRASESVRDLLRTRPFLERILFHSNPDFLQRLPETFLAACVLFLAAAALLHLSSPRPGADAEEIPHPVLRRPPAGLLLLPLAAFLVFFLVHRAGLLGSPFAATGYLLLLLAACVPLLRDDRRQELRLGFTLSRTEILVCLAGSLALFALYAAGLNSWNVAFTGDDWPFFETAEHLAQKSVWSVPWLSGLGPDRHWPMLISGWQSLFVRLFGATNSAWRSSMSILTVSALVPLYLLLRRLLAPVTTAPGIAAFVGCGCFFTSEIILAWARIGLGNAALSLPLIAASALMMAGLRRGTRSHLFLAGIAAGAGCFFSPLAALFPLAALPAYLFLDAVWPGGRPAPRTLAMPLVLFFAGFLLGAAPILAQFDYLSGLFHLNFLSAEPRAHAGRGLARTIEAGLAFLQFGAADRFLFRNVLDPLMALLAVGGVSRLARMPRTPALFGVASLLTASIVSGGLAMYATAPVTRILPVMVPVSLFAAAGFALLVSARPRVAGATALLIVSVAAALNAGKFALWNPYQSQIEFPNIEMKRIQESPPSKRHILFLPPGRTDEEYGLSLMRRAYGLEDRLFLLEDDAVGLVRLETLVERYGSAAEVRVGEGRNVSRIGEIAARHGAQMGPPIASAWLQAPRPDALSYRFFDLLNTWPPL